jgi:tRNA/tmRNA/rRNA uracil-C5-methylase (TrmA/RlmC/RlmD family)
VQAQIRARGASSLLDKDLFSVLRLTEKQMEELAEKQREAQKELQEQIKKLTLKYRQGVIRDVLTTEQLKKLEQLTGEPYEAQTTRAIPSGSFFQEFPLILGHSHWAVTNKNVRRGLRIFVMVVA